MTSVAVATHAVPESHYSDHPGRGETPMRSNPVIIHRDLTALEVTEGMRVCEIGTGSGYSGGLLAALVGPAGHVTSLDIDPYLVRWARIIHHELGITNIHCVTADGVAGYPADAPYQRLIAWCTPPLLPRAWVEQVADGGVIVTPLPIAALPAMTVVARIRVTGGQPEVESLTSGGYMPTTTAPSDSDVPTREVDWEYRLPAPAWISIAWRDEDDALHAGARGALDLLRAGTYTTPYAGPAIDWSSWVSWVAATGDRQLTVSEINQHHHAIGHSTPTSAAVIQPDGLIVADSPTSPSLEVLTGWLAGWEHAGRPRPETYRPALVHDGLGTTGWHLRLSR